MDAYYPKTRRPIAHRHNPLKRPAPPTITKEKQTQPPLTPQTPQPPRPSTPTHAKLVRPSQPPAIKKKQVPDEVRQARKPTISVRELFKTVHPLKRDEPESTEQSKQPDPCSPSKISTGPLKGVSTSLLDLIRAKEAKVKETPEELRERELLGIATDVTRIVHNVFTANKCKTLPYQIIVEKCHKGLKSNYSTSTIEDCLTLMHKVAPEWVTDVTISRGRFVRLNKDKYDWPQLSKAIELYKKPTR